MLSMCFPLKSHPQSKPVSAQVEIPHFLTDSTHVPPVLRDWQWCLRVHLYFIHIFSSENHPQVPFAFTSLSAGAAGPPVGAFSTDVPLCPSWVGALAGATTSFTLLMGLKQTHSGLGFWGFWGSFLGFFFPPEVHLRFLLNIVLLLSWIYKPHQISSNKTPLPTPCLSFLYFRGPLWMVTSHFTPWSLFSSHPWK